MKGRQSERERERERETKRESKCVFGAPRMAPGNQELMCHCRVPVSRWREGDGEREECGNEGIINECGGSPPDSMVRETERCLAFP